MLDLQRISVQVNDELALDFGSAEVTVRDNVTGLLLTPSDKTPFQQLVAYLDGKPEPIPTKRTRRELEAFAAMALTVRWGSYYAVLADSAGQAWRFNDRICPAGIDDEEMARINIEASAAMGEWVKLYLTDPGQKRTLQLARRAEAYLPMYRKPAPTTGALRAWLIDLAPYYRPIRRLERTEEEKRERTLQQVPWRVLGNILVYSAYRNTAVIENVHAGRSAGLQITSKIDKALQNTVTSNMKEAYDLLTGLLDFRNTYSWQDCIRPFIHVARTWSTTESSRNVFLPFEA